MEKLIKFELRNLIYSKSDGKVINLRDLYGICESVRFIDFLEIIFEMKEIKVERLIDLANEVLEERGIK